MTHPYIPASEAEEREMLKVIGVKHFADLLEPVPAGLRLQQPVNIGAPRSELEIVRELGAWANKNAANSKLACFLGAGLYDHYIPSVIDHVTMRSEFYTAYTPYQAEVSQGTLIAIYEFQTMVSELTGLPVANASLYDGGSATGEAGLLALSVTNRRKLVVAGPYHPAYLQVLKTYVEAGGAEVVVDPVNTVGLKSGGGHGHGVTDLEWLRSVVDDQTAAVFVQHPNFFGQLEKVHEIREISAAQGALMIASVDLLTLGILAPPADYGADLAIGESQPLGIPMAFGGPVAGFFAASEKYVRYMPGRLVGETVDKDGKRAFTLTLQTREQHIRREKATSNICTNQTLLAHRATVYMTLLGPHGIRAVGEQCLFRSRHAAHKLAELPGFKLAFGGPFVKEFVVECPCPARVIVDGALQHDVLAGVDLGRFRADWQNLLMVAVTEKRSAGDIDDLVYAVRHAAAGQAAGHQASTAGKGGTGRG